MVFGKAVGARPAHASADTRATLARRHVVRRGTGSTEGAIDPVGVSGTRCAFIVDCILLLDVSLGAHRAWTNMAFAAGVTSIALAVLPSEQL
jgi:prolyl-tRNA editing enzyme YbaK/EbsC (Cys-tRNA(Pro) deacylase)